MDEKPGCIHPGDPEGCVGTFVVVVLAVVAAALVVAGHVFMGRR